MARQSGSEYKYYSVYKIGAELDAAPGNYIFAEESSPDIFLPIYVGQTSDLSERFDSHYAMPYPVQPGDPHSRSQEQWR